MNNPGPKPPGLADLADFVKLFDQNVFSLPKAKPYGPEPIGYEPVRHPIRRWMWRTTEWAWGRLYLAANKSGDWLSWQHYNAQLRARKHYPKPIYAPGAWEPYRTIKWGMASDFEREDPNAPD